METIKYFKEQPELMEQKSVFLKIFGDSPKLRIIDFLVVHSAYDYSMKDIANNSSIGYSTLKKLWSELVKGKIVVKTRDVGNAKLYKLNMDNPFVSDFVKFYWKSVFGRAKNNLKDL